MIVDFKHLKKSIGKTLKFEASYIINGSRFNDGFYAVLKEINEDSLIVEETFVSVEDGYQDTLKVQKRLLKKGSFLLSREIPLNG